VLIWKTEINTDFSMTKSSLPKF